jgi:hypothetical protein
MYCLRVELSTEAQDGTIKESGKAYKTFRIIMKILKDDNGFPLIETDPGRAVILKDMALKFSSLKETERVEDSGDEPPMPGDKDLPF